jgi:hypothetical protein
MTATTALRQLDPDFEDVSASLMVPVWLTFLRVTAPIWLPATLGIAVYIFVNAMTMVAAVIFSMDPAPTCVRGGGSPIASSFRLALLSNKTDSAGLALTWAMAVPPRRHVR